MLLQVNSNVDFIVKSISTWSGNDRPYEMKRSGSLLGSGSFSDRESGSADPSEHNKNRLEPVFL